MPQTRPLPRPDDPVAPASPGTLPNTEEPTRRCSPGRCARVDAVVARERGHLAGRTELSFNAAADVDAARPALEEALCGVIAAEEGCGPEPARERTLKLVEGLERPKAKRGSGGRGKRGEAVAVRRLSEVRDREITHELRWNRCAVLAVSLELTAIEAALLAAVSMFCVTGAFVCWETRTGLMAMARIKTNASFAAAMASLVRRGLVPVDGAPRTAWYLGESFWGGLLAGEELDTPVAKLVRGRRRSGRSGVEGFRRGDLLRQVRTARAGGGIRWCRKPNQWPGAPERQRRPELADRGERPQTRRQGWRRSPGACRPERQGARDDRQVRCRGAGRRPAPREDRGAPPRLLRQAGRVARSRQRGLAAPVRGDLTGLPPRSLEDAGARRGGRFDAADPWRGRCRQCGERFELPGTGGDRGDGVCRACDLHPRTRAPVNVGSIVDGLTEHLRNRD